MTLKAEEVEIIEAAARVDPAFARKVGFSVEAGIPTGTPIPGSFVITDVWAVPEGSTQRATTIPIGSKFNVRCAFTAVNQGGGSWTALVTVKGTVNTSLASYGALNTFNSTNLSSPGEGLLMDKFNGGGSGAFTMPDGTGPLTLRLKGWMKDGIAGSSDAPLPADW